LHTLDAALQFLEVCSYTCHSLIFEHLFGYVNFGLPQIDAVVTTAHGHSKVTVSDLAESCCSTSPTVRTENSLPWQSALFRRRQPAVVRQGSPALLMERVLSFLDGR